MEQYEQYVSYVEWSLVVVVVLFGVIVAIRASRPHLVKPVVQVLGAILPFVAAFVAMGLADVSVAPVAAVVALAAGAGLGILVGRSVLIRPHEGGAVVRPSPATAWLGAVGWVLVTVAVIFVGPSAASAAFTLVLAFAAMGLSESVIHVVRARSAA
jgi:hypothetical protein